MRASSTIRASLLAFCVAGASAASTHAQAPPPPQTQRADTTQRLPGDDLAAELTRCLQLGDDIIHDPTCLRAWGDYGRRFLRAAPPAPGTPQQRQAPAPSDGAR
jgi:conjugative transfer region protein TrbK